MEKLFLITRECVPQEVVVCIHIDWAIMTPSISNPTEFPEEPIFSPQRAQKQTASRNLPFDIRFHSATQFTTRQLKYFLSPEVLHETERTRL